MNLSTDQYWSNFYEQGRDFRLASSQEIDRFLTYALLEAPKTHLDLGCGTGQLTRELHHRGYASIGVDASGKAIERARQLTVAPEGLSYFQADLEQSDLKEKVEAHAPYGLITCKLVYAFIENKAGFLEAIKELLHPQGLFVMITPMRDDVEENKKSIAIDALDLELAETHFKTVAVYKLQGLTYFIGQR